MVTTSDRDLSDGRVELTEIIGEFVSASNLTVLAIDAAGAKWVYKAERAMTELWDFDARTLPRREVAAFVLSEALGLDLIPLTALATGPWARVQRRGSSRSTKRSTRDHFSSPR